jgi:malonate-semialdehyde dehydrogenase (acetylating)/methylmalonate-semialdehyde dehydrogenase
MAGSVLMGVGRHTADEWRERVGGALAGLKLDDTSVNDAAGMGPVIDATAQKRVNGVIDTARGKGADIAYRGAAPGNGFFVGPTLLDHVQPTTTLFQDEIFGPVLSLVRPESLDEAIATMNRVGYGNGATIFTSSGAAARQFTREIQCGMLGINVGVPAPMALFSFSGWNASFYGDLHVQGNEGVLFYTRQRVVLSRWDKGYVRAQGW